MKKRWNELYKKLESLAAFNNSYQFFDFYPKSYSDSSRYYHTIDHIEFMLDNLDKFFGEFVYDEDKIKLELAIWYHDIIYNVHNKPGVNEYESSLKFKELGEYIGLPKDLIQEIIELILITTHDKKPINLLQKIICDLDLLGMGTGDYFKHGENFRLEFKHLSDDQWKKGRIDFLEFMLNKKSIFHTALIKNKFELNAKKNLTQELFNLKNYGK